MDQRKILVLVSQEGAKANGGLVSLKNILLGMRRTSTTIITQKRTLFNQEMVNNGARVVVWSSLPESNKVFRILNLIYFNIRLFFFLLANRYEAIHVNDIQFLLKGVFGMRMSGYRPTMNIRDTNEPERSYGRHWKLVAGCRKLIALSKEMQQDFKNRLPISLAKKNKLLTFVYSIVDHHIMQKVTVEEKAGIRKSLSVSSESFYVVIVAKIAPKKQQLELLENLCTRFREIPKLRIDFVGDFNAEHGYDQSCLKVVQEKDQLGQVVFRGFQSNVASYYQAADLVMIPSQREGLARCMIEGLSCGTPVLSFSVCSAVEIIDSYNCGKVVEQGDYDGLFEALSWFEKSKVERKAMGERGWKASRELFDREAIIDQYEKLFFSSSLN